LRSIKTNSSLPLRAVLSIGKARALSDPSKLLALREEVLPERPEIEMEGLTMRSGCGGTRIPSARAMLMPSSAAACRVQPPLPRRRLLFPRQQQGRPAPPPPQASFDDTGASSSSPAAEKDLDTSHDNSSRGSSSSRGNGNGGFLTPVASTSSNGGLRGLGGNEDDEDEDDTAEAAAAADYWSDLLNTPEPDMLGARARSASDAGVLRRKGHLKEQDALIDFMRSMHATHSAAEVMAKLDRWVGEHRADPARSRLRRLIPGIGAFFTPLDLTGEEGEERRNLF
jgi:hypothetical protein